MLNSANKRVSAVRPTLLILGLAAILVAVWILPTNSFADDSQRGFPTPQAAVDALVAAVKTGDSEAAITPILGPDAEKIISSGDKVEDENARKRFISAYGQMHRLAYDTDRRVI